MICKIRLYHPDGSEAQGRPSESRLYRPDDDEFQDMFAITASLQEALSREKYLEDKIVAVKSMISKHIGRSQTDLMRIFEDIKEELMNYDVLEKPLNANIDSKVVRT